MSFPPVIAAAALRKVYPAPRRIRDWIVSPRRPLEPVTALAGVDLEVERGEVFGLLGPNGAGKTTLLKVLACLVLPTSGRALVNGFSVSDQEGSVKSSLGYVTSDERSFYWRLSGHENLRFFASLYGLQGAGLRRRCDELLDKVELGGEAADEQFMNYSSGMRQRLAIARALLHDPPVLFMDEPTRSLDPLTAARLREFVRDQLVGREGKTILLATHNLSEAEAVCSRVGVLVRGRMRRAGTPGDLRRWAGGTVAHRVEAQGGAAVPAGCRRVRPGTPALLEVAHDCPGGLDGALRRLQAAGWEIVACEKVEPSFEGVFERICLEEAG
jgi:ABC-2 type transport system ATP-binding protein